MKPKTRSTRKPITAVTADTNINKKKKIKAAKRKLKKSIENSNLNKSDDCDKLSSLEKSDDELFEDEVGDDKIMEESVNSGSELPSGDEGESEEEEEMDSEGEANEVTLKHVKSWEKELKDNRGIGNAFKKIEQALSAAIESIGDKESEEINSIFVVRDPKVFNAVVSLCLTQVAPALQRIFGLKCLSDRPAKNKKWKKMNVVIKNYLKKIVILTQSITDPTAIQVLLKKGVLPILPFYVEFRHLSWLLMKQMATFWCTSDEKVRVLALIVIFRLLRSMKVDFREKALKLLYMSYVKNCVFTSPNTWPMINFMRDSLVELYKMNEPLAYRQAFLYIKQLAFHLRNAMLVQKTDRIQLVSNWRYMHCLHLWADLLGKSHSSNILEPLIYPLTQIATGVIGLLKSPKYYPLIFHACNILISLSHESGVFIPVMPHLLDILLSNMRSKKPSVKPIQWSCILKVPNTQVGESAFCDGLIDQVYDSLITYMNNYCSSIAFPEFVFPAVIQMKSFLKKCKFPNYTKKIKQLLVKVEENIKFINERRKEIGFSISDSKSVKNWEIATLQSNPPLHAYFLQWKKVRESNPARTPDDEDEKDPFSIAAVRKRQRSSSSAGDEAFDDDSFKDEEEPEKKKKKSKQIDSSIESNNSQKESKETMNKINKIFGADAEKLMRDDDQDVSKENKSSSDTEDDDGSEDDDEADEKNDGDGEEEDLDDDDDDDDEEEEEEDEGVGEE